MGIRMKMLIGRNLVLAMCSARCNDANDNR